MKKPAWSIVLLCLAVVALVLAVALAVKTGITLEQMEYIETDPSGDHLSGAEFIGLLFAQVSVWLGLLLGGGLLSAVGFVAALISRRIAPDIMVRRISVAFAWVHGAILLAAVGALVYCVAAVV